MIKHKKLPGHVRRIRLRPLTIRALVALWAGSALLAWALLVGGWFIAKTRLSMITNEVMIDMRALGEARELESAILAHRHEDLLWETTGRSDHHERAREHLKRAEGIVTSMDPYVTTPAEQELLMQIHHKLIHFREEKTPTTVSAMEMEARTVDDLIEVVSQYQAQNESQMKESILAANRLHSMVGYWALGLSAGTAVLLLIGALSLLRRVIYPVWTLSDAARDFGKGDFSTKAPILHDDEMGTLARTFNNMASDTAAREMDRLRFVAMVVHDLKNPVLAIEIALRLLRNPEASEEERSMCLDGIADEARRLRQIVRDLTDDIQVASGHFTVQKAEVDLGSLAQRFVQEHAKFFSTHRIVAETIEGCTVMGDSGRIERILLNLVSNAVKYSPHDTRVTVRVGKRDSSALLTIADEGPGIPEEDLMVLFQPFGRGRSADTLAEGTGMGLYVVQQIVEAHDGRIEVQSEPGRGTMIQIELALVRSIEAVQ
jgi:signal transduction histidine kinase